MKFKMPHGLKICAAGNAASFIVASLAYEMCIRDRHHNCGQQADGHDHGIVPVGNRAHGHKAQAGPGKYLLNNYPVSYTHLFDAAWGNEDTQKILEILAKHNVHATFFMTGGWVDSYPEDVKAILAGGHDLGNHSENHKNMSQISNCLLYTSIIHFGRKSL